MVRLSRRMSFWIGRGEGDQRISPTLRWTCKPLPTTGIIGTTVRLRRVLEARFCRIVDHVSSARPAPQQRTMVVDFRSPPCLPRSVKKISRHCDFPAHEQLRIEPRRHWPRRSPCAKPQVSIDGDPGDPFIIESRSRQQRRSRQRCIWTIQYRFLRCRMNGEQPSERRRNIEPTCPILP